MYRLILLSILLCFSSCKNQEKQNTTVTSSSEEQNKPNIIIFYVDDLGYGDLGCYGAIGVETPNIDKLAENGIKFTDAHSPAATCTPSRYSLLTGEYAFRKNAAILPGDAPILIKPGIPTLPAMLKKAGYKTGVVGKWHLGIGNGNIDWNSEVKPGPLEIGFDYSFLLPATGDRVPTVYLENHNVVNLKANDSLTVNYKNPIGNDPTGISNPELLRQKADEQHSQAIVNGISRIGYQDGGKEALWVDEDFPKIFSDKAKNFINTNKDTPFFLYFAFHDIHVPRVPNEKFIGKSSMGLRGDAIAQMDWVTGNILDELKRLKLDKNTLVIFTSDNGPVLDDGYEDEAEEKLGDHKPSGPFRGGKYSAFEAGTRVPMITHWPNNIKQGESDALISHIDFYASLASLLNIELESKEAIDSENTINALLNADSEARSLLLEESFTLSLRTKEWKYTAPLSKKNTPAWLSNKKIEMGLSPKPQLYNISNDIKEQHNVVSDNKMLGNRMQARIDSIIKIK